MTLAWSGRAHSYTGWLISTWNTSTLGRQLYVLLFVASTSLRAAWTLAAAAFSGSFTAETSRLAAQSFLFLVMLLLGGFLLSVGAPAYPCLELRTVVQADLLEKLYAAAPPSALSPLFDALDELCFMYFTRLGLGSSAPSASL